MAAPTYLPLPDDDRPSCGEPIIRPDPLLMAAMAR
jgi:hypothetical protein